MANIPLKSINFPGLGDTYTVPVVDNTLSVPGGAADAKVTGSRMKLLCDEIPNTVQEYTFTGGAVSQVAHKSGSAVVRTDAFIFTDEAVTETRTLNTGEALTIVTNLTTLETTVTYTAAA